MTILEHTSLGSAPGTIHNRLIFFQKLSWVSLMHTMCLGTPGIIGKTTATDATRKDLNPSSLVSGCVTWGEYTSLQQTTRRMAMESISECSYGDRIRWFMLSP